MAKITYEFNSDDDSRDLLLIQNADKLYFALDEIFNLVRNCIKHGDPLPEPTLQLLETLQEKASIIHQLDE